MWSVDGHNEDELKQAFAAENKGAPKAIIARTIKGKGVSFLENSPTSHHSVLKDAQYEQAIQEVENGEV